MTYFKWDSSLDVKVSKMNDEHKILINCMNRLREKYQQQAPRGEVAKALSDLQKYTMEHFRDEEAFMKSINYPVFDSHKRIHDDLLATLQKHKTAFEQSGELSEPFFVFLKSWLMNHIKISDVAYGGYSEKRQLNTTAV